MCKPLRLFPVSLLVCLVAGAAVAFAAPVTVLDRVEFAAGAERVVNGGFEARESTPVPGWYAWGEGYAPAAGEGRGGSRGITCGQADTRAQHGAGQSIELNQDAPRGIAATGWSRAEQVEGTPDPGYSIYLDIEYMDGTFLWGQTVSFSTGTHDWEMRRRLVEPEKAIRRVTIYPMFRGHTGRVWFDDFSLAELTAAQNAHFFEGVPVRLNPDAAAGAARLVASDGSPEGAPLFFVRDVAADSGFVAPERWEADGGAGATFHGAVPELALSIVVSRARRGDAAAWSARVEDTSGQDRALTAYFALPAPGRDWTWWEDMRRARAAERGVLSNTLATGAGATGRRSRYPLAALTRGAEGLALATPIDDPRHHRLGYDAECGLFFAAFDFALSRDAAKSPAAAACEVFAYAFDGAAGFRGALAKYYGLFPAAFTKRVPREGLWMAFTDIATVAGWEDFGFAFHEGVNNVPWDGAQGILSFEYIEPMTTWLPMPPETPRTREAAFDLLRAQAAGDDAEGRRRASQTLTSCIRGADGSAILSIENAPWCNGAVFALNADPDVPRSPEWPINQADFALGVIENAGTTFTEDKGRLDGAYIDSYEFWANSIDYDRAHFAAADLPLVYDAATLRPGILTAFATFEFQRELAARMRAQDRLMMANGVLNQYEFPAACLDVLGTETNWFPGGRWEPLSDAELCFRRAMSFQRPYCFLLNTHYASLKPEDIKKYMRRCLFYGMFPGFFSENAATDCFFATPAYYEPVRPLFKKYLPLIRRIAAAGWQPLPHAVVDNPRLYVERYGDPAQGVCFFTVLNEAENTQAGELRINTAGLGLGASDPAVRELVSEMSLSPARTGTDIAVPLELPACGVALIELASP